MGVASRTKWQRRKKMGKKVRPGKIGRPYAETIRKQEKLSGA